MKNNCKYFLIAIIIGIVAVTSAFLVVQEVTAEQVTLITVNETASILLDTVSNKVIYYGFPISENTTKLINQSNVVNDDGIKTIEPLKKVNYKKTKYSPISVKMNSTDIFIEGAYPTVAGFGYQRYNVHLLNYFNGEWGCLYYEQEEATWSGASLEGMLVYHGNNKRIDDKDFDIVSGREHIIGSKDYLTVVSRSVY
jgi:hypothetical protein